MKADGSAKPCVICRLGGFALRVCSAQDSLTSCREHDPPLDPGQRPLRSRSRVCRPPGQGVANKQEVFKAPSPAFPSRPSGLERGGRSEGRQRASLSPSPAETELYGRGWTSKSLMPPICVLPAWAAARMHRHQLPAPPLGRSSLSPRGACGISWQTGGGVGDFGRSFFSTRGGRRLAENRLCSIIYRKQQEKSL